MPTELVRARGIVDSRPHSTDHPSPFQTCPRLSDWMQFSLAIHQQCEQAQHINKILRAKDKSYTNTHTDSF